MRTILDIHTHHPAPQPEAVVCVTPENFNPMEGQLYSCGIHPWDSAGEIPDSVWEALATAARHPQVKAIGECGLDLVKGGALFRQMQVMKRTDAGIWLSFGQHFNHASVQETPTEMLLAETDESAMPISEIITSLSVIKGHDLTDEIRCNALRWLALDRKE